MVNIFKDTHQRIASNIYQNVYKTYDLKLDKEKLLWGSVAPDIVPRLKMHRHYKKESLKYVVNQIVKLIQISKYINIDSNIDPITLKVFSQKIGIISHFLSDFVCLPHAQRWTFISNMFKHISYESKLREYALNYTFNKNIIQINDIDIFDDKNIKLKYLVKEYIEKVIKEYSLKEGYKNDLDYSLCLSLKIIYFMIDTINVYNENTMKQFAFEF